MAYTVNRTDGSLVASVADGTIDNTTTSLVLFGKNYAGYGEALNENYVRLLENHASSTQPENPQVGQTWFNPSDKTISVYNGTEFKPLGTAGATPGQPEASVLGETWFDTVNSQLHVYDGEQFILVGPSSASGTGTSGVVVETITDTLAVTHIVMKFYVGSTSGATDVVAIISKDASFTPKSGEQVPGFATINPGMQLATSVGSETPLFVGDATNALKFGGLDPDDYLSSIGNDETSGSLSILNDSGLTVGLTGDAILDVAGDDVRLSNTNSDGSLLFTVDSLANGITDVITIDGTTARARVTTPTGGSNALEIANKTYVDTTVSGAVSGSGFLPKDGSEDMAGDLTFGLNHQLLADLGSVAAPGISFNGDSDSGMYSSSANAVSFITGGTTRLTIESNGTLNVLGTTNYETLVTADDDIPNKKYVDDKVNSTVDTAAIQFIATPGSNGERGTLIDQDGLVGSGTIESNWTRAAPAALAGSGARFALVEAYAQVTSANSANLGIIRVYVEKKDIHGGLGTTSNVGGTEPAAFAAQSKGDFSGSLQAYDHDTNTFLVEILNDVFDYRITGSATSNGNITGRVRLLGYYT